jgi:hypothetical protein
MTIANGEPGDGQRLSSARITVNGVLVTAPSCINQKVAAITIPLNVAIGKSNTVSVEHRATRDLFSPSVSARSETNATSDDASNG